MNCDEVFQLLLSHVTSNTVNFLSLVIELDIPWDESQVKEYGQFFAPWGEKTFKKLVKSLTTNLMTIPFTMIVSA